MRFSIVLVLTTACANRPPPARPADPPAVASAEPAPAAAPTPAPAPAAMPALPASPVHRVLQWLVDVIAHRKGEVPREEIADYCGPQFLTPVAGTADNFRKWASEADGAVLESLEVDDATYVRGYLATRDHRWKLILEIDPATSKLTYVRFESAR